MSALEVIGLIGELFSWIGLTPGLALLLLVLVLRTVDGEMTATEIIVVNKPDAVMARWFAAGDLHERPLGAWECDRLAGRDSAEAFVSNRTPGRMRLDAHRPMVRMIWTIGLVLTIVGGCGFVASWLPAFFG